MRTKAWLRASHSSVIAHTGSRHLLSSSSLRTATIHIANTVYFLHMLAGACMRSKAWLALAALARALPARHACGHGGHAISFRTMYSVLHGENIWYQWYINQTLFLASSWRPFMMRTSCDKCITKQHLSAQL